MERSVLIQGVGLDASGAQRHKLTLCKYSSEPLSVTIALMVPALMDNEVVRVCLDIALPNGGENTLTT